jgi:hypothetical protein
MTAWSFARVQLVRGEILASATPPQHIITYICSNPLFQTSGPKDLSTKYLGIYLTTMSTS